MRPDFERGLYVFSHGEAVELGITLTENPAATWPMDRTDDVIALINRARIRLYERGAATGRPVASEHWRVLDTLESQLYGPLAALGEVSCSATEVSPVLTA